MQIVGKIDIEIYSVVSSHIKTDEVVITEERIQHIRDRHPHDFERYSMYLKDLVENPQYILEANKPDTAFILKEYNEENQRFQLIFLVVLRGINRSIKTLSSPFSGWRKSGLIVIFEQRKSFTNPNKTAII